VTATGSMECILEDMVPSVASSDDYEFANGYVLHVFNCSVWFLFLKEFQFNPPRSGGLVTMKWRGGCVFFACKW
jgi:hypothetical protein